MSEKENDHHDEEREPPSDGRKISEEQQSEGIWGVHRRLWGAVVAGVLALGLHSGGAVMRGCEAATATSVREVGALEQFLVRLGIGSARVAVHSWNNSTSDPDDQADTPGSRLSPGRGRMHGDSLEWVPLPTPEPYNWVLEQGDAELGSRASAADLKPSFLRPTLLGSTLSTRCVVRTCGEGNARLGGKHAADCASWIQAESLGEQRA